MCGIAGSYDPQGRVKLGRLQRMSALMRHRGPEDEGIVLLDARGGRAMVLGGPDTPEAVYAAALPYTPGRGKQEGASSLMSSPAHVGLVHRRLSFLDLSAAGHGPMCDASSDLWIT